VTAAVVNTRGHDLATLLQPSTGTPFWGGAAWENLEESPYDLAGWVDAAATGFSGIVLIGHSLGAVKVTYFLAERRDPRVVGLGLAAPPLRPAWDTRAHPAAVAEAERLGRNGHSKALFDGPWGPVSAQTYLSLDRIGFDQFGRSAKEPNIARIDRPICAIVGGQDVAVCTAADLDVIRRNAKAAPRVETHVIDGADHFFTGHAADLANLLVNWVATLR
jgi:pimeloyl-ACP methyl ester carboxylesterase